MCPDVAPRLSKTLVHVIAIRCLFFPATIKAAGSLERAVVRMLAYAQIPETIEIGRRAGAGGPETVTARFCIKKYPGGRLPPARKQDCWKNLRGATGLRIRF